MRLRLRAFAVLAVVVLVVLALAPFPGGDRFGGTFIGAVISEEGIVMASDSRSTFIDTNDRQVGYIDNLPKIFVQQGAAFAVSGLTSVQGELFSSFVRRNDFLLVRPVDEMLFGVALYLPFRNTTSVLLLSAGFVNGLATICAKTPTDSQICRNSGFIANKESASLRLWHAGLGNAPPKKNDAAGALRRAIAELAGSDATVGGPLSVLYLSRSAAPEWIENRTSNNAWTGVCDIVKDYRQGTAQIRFTTSKADLDRYLAAACPAAAVK